MKIADYRITVVGAPWRELTFLEVMTDDGLTGTAEIRMLNKTETLVACVRELAPRHLIGHSPFDSEQLAWRIQHSEYGRPGEVTQSALSAFDIACWDVVGQSLGAPIWKLLGGAFRDRVVAYANGWYQADRDPDVIGEKAAAVVKRGYRALKLDPFGSASAEIDNRDLRRSVEIVRAVREAVGDDVMILVEMHGRFSPHAAARVALALEGFGPEWLEEPVAPESVRALERVRSATALPIATGERVHTLPEARDMLETGLVDIIQMDMTHCGGFTAMRTLAGWSNAYHVLLAPHNVCGPVGTIANVHVAAATQNFKILEHFNDFADPWVQELVDHPPTVDPADGCFAVPDRPGLGVSLNHEACLDHPPTGGTIRLFEAGWEKRLG